MLSQSLGLVRDFPVLIFSSLLIFLVSLVLMQRSVRPLSLRRPTIPSVFYLTYIFMIFLPAFLVYRDNPGPYRDSFIISVISVMVMVPLGIIFANRLYGFKYAETERYFTALPEEPPSYKGMFVTHWLVILFLFSILADYIHHAPVLPILELINKTSDPMGLTLAREESFKLLDPRWGGPNGTQLFYAYLFLRTLLFPFIIMTALGYALFTRKLKWFFIFACVLLVGGFYAVSSLARAPISAIFMRIFFFIYLFKGAKISKKTVLTFFLLMLAFPLIVTTFANSTSRTLIDGLVAVGSRLTYSPALDLYYYFEIFPRAHDFLYGQTLLKPILKLFGAHFFYIENFVAMYISPYGVKTAHSNAAFVSNLHADFGLFGVIGGSFFCGVGMQLLHVYLVRSAKTVLNMAVYSFMIYAIWVLNFGSVTSVLLVNGVLPVLIVSGLLRLASWLIWNGVLKPNKDILVLTKCPAMVRD